MHSDPAFDLAPRLAADTLPLGDLPLSRVLRMDDVRYAWLVLVPRVAGLQAMDQLDRAARAQFMEELALASRVLRAADGANKINIGALGNIEPQLHVHVLARRPGDPAWPGPVWGQGSPVPLDGTAAAHLDTLRQAFVQLAGADFRPAQ